MAITNPTPKQVRNGADTGAPGTGANAAKPGPDFTGAIRAAKSSTESAQATRKSREGGLGVPDTTSSPTGYGYCVGGG